MLKPDTAMTWATPGVSRRVSEMRSIASCVRESEAALGSWTFTKK